jgi:peptide/nickel transport system substrate-binding protein
MIGKLKTLLLGISTALAITVPANAEALKIGLGAMAVNMDPHFQNSAPAVANMLHVFDKLVLQDANQQPIPGLATKWTRIDDMTWEFELRKDVKFHDGKPFTAADVVFSVDRASNAPGSKNSPFGVYTKSVKAIEIIDDHKIRVTTVEANPLLPLDFSTFGIVSHEDAKDAMPDDFNNGKAAVGTGPFKFVEFVSGERIKFKANPDYWGGAPKWDEVEFRLISTPAARIAALQAGDVDVIDYVPADDAVRLEKTADFNVFRTASNRIIYLTLDTFSDAPAYITGNDGKPLGKNPLRDVRVRKALSLAIDRNGIIEHILQGEGIASGQVVPEGFFGYSADIVPDAVDTAAAKALLAEAGYPDGFAMTIHGSQGRYYADDQITQALGQMFTRIGLKTNVEVLPRQVYADRGNKFEFSVGLYGWGTDTGEASSPLKALYHTRDSDRGLGVSNRGRYSNPELDKSIMAAVSVMDDGAREKALKDVTKQAVADYGIIPLWFQVSTWATRKGLKYVPRRDQFTLATSVERQ